MTDVTPAEKLRQAIDGATIQVMGAPNALSAKLIEAAGFEAIYLSGAALSAGTLGIPDVGLFTLTELTRHANYLTRVSSLPLIVDADTGFGDALNVERTVQELIRVGVAAIQLEDQQLPKRCGHLSGKTLISTDEMCAKLRAAASARGESDTILIARTDARGVEDLDAAIERAEAYLEAGADWIFPEALQSEDEFRLFAEAIDCPLLANMTEFGKSPLLYGEELAELGYAAILYPVTLLRVATKAMEAALAVIATEGSQEELLEIMLTRQELYDLIGYSDYEARDKKHFGGSGE